MVGAVSAKIVANRSEHIEMYQMKETMRNWSSIGQQPAG